MANIKTDDSLKSARISAFSESLESNSPSWVPKLRPLLAIMVLAIAAFAAARQVASWPDRLRYPGEMDNVEGRILTDMVLLRRGEPVYAPATPERYYSMEYGPSYYLLGSRLIDPQEPAFPPIRVLSMFGTLGLAAGCALLAFWLSRSYAAAALAPLVFLSYVFVTRFGVAVRSDSVALLLWFWGFLVAYRFQKSNKILWAVPLMTLGLYYKGQYLAGFLGVMLFLLLEKRFRLAATFAGTMCAGAVSLFLVFQLLVFRNQAFWLHALAYNAIRFSLFRGIAWVVLMAAILAVPSWLAVQFLRGDPNKLLACYFGWAVFLPMFTIAKMGSGMNYWYELVLVLCPLCAALLVKKNATLPRTAVISCLLVVTLWLAHFPERHNDPIPVDLAEDSAVQLYLRTHFPPHASALGIITGALLRAGMDTPIDNLYQYSWLVCMGKLPEQGLVTQLQDRRFQVILVNRDFTSEKNAHNGDDMCLTEPVHQAMLQNYKLDANFHFHLDVLKICQAWVPR